MQQLKELKKQKQILDIQIQNKYRELYLTDYGKYLLYIISDYFHINPLDIISNSRQPYIVFIRKIYSKGMLLRGYSLEYSANILNKNISTISYYNNHISEYEVEILYKILK